MKRAIRSSGSKCFSLQTPRSCGEMRPSGVTAAASVNTKRCAADRPSGKMREMPIIRVAVDRRILAHWRNDDAVGEVNVAHTKFAKQMRHGSIVSIENGRESGGWLGAARAVVMTDALMNHILRRSAVKPNTRVDPIVQGG